MLLEEFDPTKEALIEATHYIQALENFPPVCVSCFSHVTFQRILDQHNPELIITLSIANMNIPVYRIQAHGIDYAVFNAYVGAAGCIGVLEELIAYGAKKLVIFGTCGVLDQSIDDASIIIPNIAMRDEGTSYHYQAASDEIAVNTKYLSLAESFFSQRNIHYTIGKIWTTDAFYRETRHKMNQRKARGCICVDMECSAIAAWSDFRNIDVFHFFYAADNLDQESWDARSLSNHALLDEKDKIAELALQFAYEMVIQSKEV